MGLLGPFLRLREVEIFGSGCVTKHQVLPRVVSVVPSVSVESVMESAMLLLIFTPEDIFDLSVLEICFSP